MSVSCKIQSMGLMATSMTWIVTSPFDGEVYGALETTKGLCFGFRAHAATFFGFQTLLLSILEHVSLWYGFVTLKGSIDGGRRWESYRLTKIVGSWRLMQGQPSMFFYHHPRLVFGNDYMYMYSGIQISKSSRICLVGTLIIR